MKGADFCRDEALSRFSIGSRGHPFDTMVFFSFVALSFVVNLERLNKMWW